MQFIKRHALTIGIVLMFALTWPFYSALGLWVGYGLAAVAVALVARPAALSRLPPVVVFEKACSNLCGGL